MATFEEQEVALKKQVSFLGYKLLRDVKDVNKLESFEVP